MFYALQRHTLNSSLYSPLFNSGLFLKDRMFTVFLCLFSAIYGNFYSNNIPSPPSVHLHEGICSEHCQYDFIPGTLNNIQALHVTKEAYRNFCAVPVMSIPTEELQEPSQFAHTSDWSAAQKQQLTWFLFQQGAGPLPLLELSHLLLQEVRCE